MDDWENWPLVNENALLRTTLRAAHEVGAYLSRAFLSSFTVSRKADDSDVTPFDQEAEKIAKKIICEAEPEAPVLGEESGGEHGGWYLDGIDGTTNFGRGIPLCNFSIARSEKRTLGEEEEVLLGAVNCFMIGECYYAVKGRGAFCNGKKIMAPTHRAFIKESIFSINPHPRSKYNKRGVIDDNVERDRAIEAIWRAQRDICEQTGRTQRGFSSGAMEMCWVAAGKIDGFIFPATNPWDISAGAVILREAGGIITDLEGNRWYPSKKGGIAAGPENHRRLLEIVSKYYRNLDLP